LGEIGPDAVKAIPALTELLQEKDEAIRQAAAEALKRIQGHAGTER
jgi:HEAT repeat protein